jgi:DNA-binding NtrC family response regulator
VVGRGDDCDLVVPHRSVSRRHARITAGTPPTIEDLGSANGTKLRGRRLAARTPTPIEEGMTIEIGEVALIVRGAAAAGALAASGAKHAMPLARELARVERERIVDALARCGGNQTRAAAMLGISRRTLVNRLNEYDLPRPLKGPR